MGFTCEAPDVLVLPRIGHVGDVVIYDFEDGRGVFAFERMGDRPVQSRWRRVELMPIPPPRAAWEDWIGICRTS